MASPNLIGGGGGPGRYTRGEMSGDRRNFQPKKINVGALLLRLWRYLGRNRLLLVLADRVRHRDLLLNFDALRTKCKNIKPKNETVELERQLVSHALDQMAVYLRAEADNLTPDEVNELDTLFTSMTGIVDRLAKGRAFSSENHLNTASYVNHLVKKYPVKGKK